MKSDVFRDYFLPLSFSFVFFFCAAFFPFRRAKREIFVPPLRIFSLFLLFLTQTVVKDLKRVSGSRKKQKKKTERKKKKKKNSPAFCVCASKMSKDFLDSLL